MTLDEFVALRKGLGLTQTEMAGQIGLTLRGYQDVEGGASKLRKLHIAAAERAALAIAVDRGEPMLAPASVRQQALELARLITGKAHG